MEVSNHYLDICAPKCSGIGRILDAECVDLQPAINSGRACCHTSTAAEPTAELPSRLFGEVQLKGGDRLMKTVEKQLDHRITLENIGLNRSFNQSSTGQWMGFIIAVLFGLIAWDLAKNGHELTAQILGAVDLVALVTVFITGRSTSK